MERRTFLRISGCVLAALGTDPSRLTGAGEDVDRSQLEAGLHAMARADGWFDAHWGAALIAGAFLCAEGGLPEQTRSAIRTELAVLRRK